MREETMKNGRTLLKYILYAVALAVLAEFMMTLDYHSLLGAHGNSNQQLTLSMKDAELVNCEIKDGKVYINDSSTPLDDSFIPEKMTGNYGPYKVPENCYFMLGDNRNNSNDSRFWKNKFVRFDQLVGKAVVRYYPSIKWLG